MTSQEPRTAADWDEPHGRWADRHPHEGVWFVREAEAANGSALDVERLARALEAVESDGLIVVLGLGDPEERTDFTTAPTEAAAAILARFTGSPDPAALADRLVEEGRVSVWGRPGTKFTAKRAKAPDPEATA